LLAGTHDSPEGVVRAAVRQGRRGSPLTAGSVDGYGICWPSLGRAVFEPITIMPGPGELVVEVTSSIISSGTERARFLGLPNARIEFPHRPGYAASGRVVAVGPAVGGFEPGEAVALLDVPHQSIVAVPPERALIVPPCVLLADAAILQLALVAALGVHRARLQPGEPYGVIAWG
jgi:NADPH:quinone reductase-like Zn-dependent oxidoreductase